jgi:hypothetical protein
MKERFMEVQVIHADGTLYPCLPQVNRYFYFLIIFTFFFIQIQIFIFFFRIFIFFFRV